MSENGTGPRLTDRACVSPDHPGPHAESMRLATEATEVR